jgi:hypothetical protein
MSPLLATIIFGLAASLCWGCGDFSGGLASRRAHAASVVLADYGVGFVGLVILALIWKEPFPSPSDMLWGGLAGLAGMGCSRSTRPSPEARWGSWPLSLQC